MKYSIISDKYKHYFVNLSSSQIKTKMYLTAGNFILIASIIIFVALLASRASFKFGVPVLLLFLFTGMLFGSDGLGLQFNDMNLAQFIGMVALSIILFSGGMDTDYKSIRPVLAPGIALSTVGVLLTTLITGVFIYFLCNRLFDMAGYTLVFSLLLAATMSSTDSASVFNVLRSRKTGLKHNLKPLLEFESGSNDPMAYMLTIVLIQILMGDNSSFGSIVLTFFAQLAIGALAGFGMGKAAVWITNKINLHYSSLYPILMLCIIFFTFSITDLIKGNGYLAVYIAGMVVGNNPLVNKRETTKFLDGMTWLFQIVIFLTLGLLVNPSEMLPIAVPGLLIAIFMIVVGRPLSVFLTMLPFRKFSFKSKLYVSWVGLRGAAPIIFATYPVIEDVPGARNIFNIVFFITLVSLLVQGTTVNYFAKTLKLTAATPKEGNDFGVELPEDLKSKVWDITVDEKILSNGPLLMDVGFPKGVLVIMVKRGDDYKVPNGDMRLEVGDKLLMLSADEQFIPDKENISPEAIENYMRIFPEGQFCPLDTVERQRPERDYYVILYIHGMGGGGDSRIPSILSEELPQDRYHVVVRTYSFDPDEAYGQIASWMEELKPDLIVGESLGAVQAIRIKGLPHILVSPSLNAPLYLYAASFLVWIPGLRLLLEKIYRPKPGDRQELHFRAKILHSYRDHRARALMRSPKMLGDRADYFFAFFGKKDHYRRSGIVSIATYEKYFFHSRKCRCLVPGRDNAGGGAAYPTYAIYPGGHFMEEEHVRTLLAPKIKEVLSGFVTGSSDHSGSSHSGSNHSEREQ